MLPPVPRLVATGRRHAKRRDGRVGGVALQALEVQLAKHVGSLLVRRQVCCGGQGLLLLLALRLRRRCAL